MSDNVFKKCFKGCGNGDLYSLDQAADAFQSCLEQTGCSDKVCGTNQFIKFKDACQHLQPTPQSKVDEILAYCKLNCDDIPGFKQCVYDRFAEYQTLDKVFQDAEDLLVKGCTNPSPVNPQPQPVNPQPNPFNVKKDADKPTVSPTKKSNLVLIGGGISVAVILIILLIYLSMK